MDDPFVAGVDLLDQVVQKLLTTDEVLGHLVAEDLLLLAVVQLLVVVRQLRHRVPEHVQDSLPDWAETPGHRDAADKASECCRVIVNHLRKSGS